MTDTQYNSATGGDLPAIQLLLADCRLPADGIELVGDNCLVAKVDSKLVGMVALEPYGRAGLFRSLAVAPDYRGRSLGRSLWPRMVSHARLLGGLGFLIHRESKANKSLQPTAAADQCLRGK